MARDCIEHYLPMEQKLIKLFFFKFHLDNKGCHYTNNPLHSVKVIFVKIAIEIFTYVKWMDGWSDLLCH